MQVTPLTLPRLCKGRRIGPETAGFSTETMPAMTYNMPLLAYFVVLMHVVVAKTAPPNVVVFLVDDLGYGDLGIQGNVTLSTPNIDRIGIEGVRFTHWLSGSSICTPSRAAFMTGRLAQRMGMANSNVNARVMSPSAPGGLPHEEITLAEKLKEKNYATHMSGKWHLGIGKNGAFLPTAHGFDEYYGMGVTNVQSCDPTKTIYIQGSLFSFYLSKTWETWIMLALLMSSSAYVLSKKTSCIFLSLLFVGLILGVGYYYTATYTLLNQNMCLLYRDKEIVQQPVNLHNLTQRLTADAEQFIRREAVANNNFFLFMSYVKVHTALFANGEFKGKGGSAGEYGDNIAELDWSIGHILDTLDELKVGDNTLIWFTSDNGPFLERGLEGGSSGYVSMENGEKAWLRGGKGQQWEGGVRVPGLMRWRQNVKGGRTLSDAVSTMDIFPTTIGAIERALNANTALYDSAGLDGRDIYPLFAPSRDPADPAPSDLGKDRLFVHYCGIELAAARLGNQYKVHWETPKWEKGLNSCPATSVCGCTGQFIEKHDPPLLYDLLSDPAESNVLTPENFDGYHAILKQMNSKILEHIRSMKEAETRQNQLDIFSPRLFLNQVYPCCNPPACKCDKDFLDMKKREQDE